MVVDFYRLNRTVCRAKRMQEPAYLCILKHRAAFGLFVVFNSLTRNWCRHYRLCMFSDWDSARVCLSYSMFDASGTSLHQFIGHIVYRQLGAYSLCAFGVLYTAGVSGENVHGYIDKEKETNKIDN